MNECVAGHLWIIYLFSQVAILINVLNPTAKGSPCFGGGRGEEGHLKMRIRSNMKRGQGRYFKGRVSVVTNEVPVALMEVTWANAAAPPERRVPPPCRGSHSSSNNLAAPATGIKRAAEGKAMCVRRLKAGGVFLLPRHVRQACLGGPRTTLR